MSSSGELQSVTNLFRNSGEIGGTAEPTPGSTVAGYDFHPFIEIESRGVFELPEGSWDVSAGKAPFAGWAVSTGSPVWTSLAPLAAAPQSSILVSRGAFAASFNRETYVEGISATAPHLMVDDWLDRNPEGQPLATLLVSVPYERGLTQYRSFDIFWLESLPSVQRIAYVMPLELYQPLMRSALDPLYAYIPGHELVASSDFVSRLVLEDSVAELGQDGARSAGEAMQRCLGLAQPGASDLELTSLDLSLVFNIPVERPSLDHCLAEAALSPTIYPVVSDFFSNGRPVLRIVDGQMEFTCSDLGREVISARPDLAACTDGAETVRFSPFADFSSGFAYVPDRAGIEDFVLAVDNARVGERRALFIGELYRSSIDRFRYLVSTLDYIAWPMAMFFAVIAVYSMFASTSMFFAHRRINYGVLMARGMGVFEIRRVIYAQFAACFVLACAASYLVLNLTKVLLQNSFAASGAFGLAFRQLGIQSPMIVDSPLGADPGASLLLSFTDIGFGAGVILVFMALIIEWQMWRLPLRAHTYPMDLIANATS